MIRTRRPRIAIAAGLRKWPKFNRKLTLMNQPGGAPKEYLDMIRTWKQPTLPTGSRFGRYGFAVRQAPPAICTPNIARVISSVTSMPRSMVPLKTRLAAAVDAPCPRRTTRVPQARCEMIAASARI